MKSQKMKKKTQLYRSSIFHLLDFFQQSKAAKKLVAAGWTARRLDCPPCGLRAAWTARRLDCALPGLPAAWTDIGLTAVWTFTERTGTEYLERAMIGTDRNVFLWNGC